MFLVFTKIYMPPRRRLPSLGPNVDGVGTLRLKGGGLAGVGQVAPVRFLPGLRRLPRQGSCRGKAHLVPSLLAPLSWRCSGSLVSLLPLLSRQARTQACGRDCPRTSKGVQKGPLLLYTDRSPRAWATYKRGALLVQAQNGARARAAEFYRGNSLASCASPRPTLNV